VAILCPSVPLRALAAVQHGFGLGGGSAFSLGLAPLLQPLLA
jgi:hypothetical protein